jgi:hypothetical protein
MLAGPGESDLVQCLDCALSDQTRTSSFLLIDVHQNGPNIDCDRTGRRQKIPQTLAETPIDETMDVGGGPFIAVAHLVKICSGGSSRGVCCYEAAGRLFRLPSG